MTPKEERFIKTWELAKNMGRLKYAITYGAFFGIFTFIISSVILRYVFSETEGFLLKDILIKVVLFIVVGFLLSYYFMWQKNTIKYNELTKK